MNVQKSIRLQIAADLVGDLADAVEALGKQLDRLHEEIGEDLFSRVAQAFPVDHGAFGPKANAALVKLMHQLTPPDDYDAADNHLRQKPMKREQRFTVGEQPCQHFLRGDADIAALGEGNRRNLHQCPKCEGNRAWCDACHTDHHDGGWETCKPGAYADPPDED